MKSLLLSLAIAISLSAAALAQAVSVTPGEGQLWWANYDLDAGVRYVTGTESAPECYDAAVFIPQGLLGDGSMTVDGLSFYPVTESMKNVKVWVCASLPASSDEWLETVSVDDSAIKRGQFTDVAFTKPHLIPATGLYVGVTFDVTSLNVDNAGTPLSYTSTDRNRENSFFYKTSSKLKWTGIDGNAYVRVLFGGGNFTKNAVSVRNFSTGYAKRGESVSVPLTLRNMGTADVENITYSITTDGVTSNEVTKAVGIKGFQVAGSTSIDFPADTEAKAYEKVLTITKVNGQRNGCADNRASGRIITVTENYQAVPVVEMFVGTDYRYSPIGMVGLDRAQGKYGDQVVLIAVHYDDVMAIEDYNSLIYNVSTIPSSFLDRQYEVYPSSAYLLNSVANALTRAVPGKISLKAEWDPDVASASGIKLNATAEFCYEDAKANYGVAYVIIADGLKGEGTEWQQKNGYAGDTGGEEMKFWYDSPAMVSGVSYDRVAIAAKDVFSGADLTGISNPLQQGVRAGETMFNSSFISIADNKLVQDRGKLTAVALLIDRSNNQIVNAAKAAISNADASGKGDVNGDGVVDVADISAIISVMATVPDGEASATADVNGDGAVDVADISTVITIMAGGGLRPK